MELIKDLGVCNLGGKSKRHYGIWQCPNCPTQVTTTFSKMKVRTYMLCSDCARIEAFELRRNKKEMEFINKADKFHNSKYDYGKVKYINNHTKVIIVCPEHGEFLQTPSAHYKHGCQECYVKSRRKLNEDFIKDATKVHNSNYNYEDVNYINSITLVNIICCACNNTFTQRPNDHLNGSGCPECNTGSDQDSFYIWKLVNTNKYKIGITSSRLKQRRITQVVKALQDTRFPMEGYEIVVQITTHNAKDIESYIHNKYTNIPTDLPKGFDGYTEFRVLTNSEEQEILNYIRNQYAVTKIVQTDKNKSNTNM